MYETFRWYEINHRAGVISADGRIGLILSTKHGWIEVPPEELLQFAYPLLEEHARIIFADTLLAFGDPVIAAPVGLAAE